MLEVVNELSEAPETKAEKTIPAHKRYALSPWILRERNKKKQRERERESC